MFTFDKPSPPSGGTPASRRLFGLKVGGSVLPLEIVRIGQLPEAAYDLSASLLHTITGFGPGGRIRPQQESNLQLCLVGSAAGVSLDGNMPSVRGSPPPPCRQQKYKEQGGRSRLFGTPAAPRTPQSVGPRFAPGAGVPFSTGMEAP